MIYFRSAAGIIISLLFLSGDIVADEYKKYQRESGDSNFLKVSFSDGQTILTMYGDTETETVVFSGQKFRIRGDTLFIKNRATMIPEGFIFSDGFYSSELINKIKTEIDDGQKTEIYFLKKKGADRSRLGARRKNRIGINQDVRIGDDEFIRGSVASFWSNITIDGEVSGNVVALFGDINVGDKAVIRGDIISLDGKVNLSQRATVYGKIQASNYEDEQRSYKLWRWYRRDTDLSPLVKFHYNRIDGAAPHLGLKFTDEESRLPEIEAYAGYGFESERWRYNIGIKQHILPGHNLTFGAAAYKRLASDDDRLISETENTLFALLATEDFKDYYEAEGGYLFSEFRPIKEVTAHVGFRIEEHKWLDHHSELWSLFGGSKRFRSNFSSVEGLPRLSGISQIDGSDMKSLELNISYSNYEDRIYPDQSFHSATFKLDWTPSDWNDDYDLTRFLINLTRYQVLNRHSGIIFKGYLGGSDGDLPMHRLFYMGGPGTLYGYENKEFYGEEFWMVNIEYRFDIEYSDVDGWLYFNTGQMAPPGEDLSDGEVKNSIGIAFSLGDTIKLYISKRLDRRSDTARLDVRMKHEF
jgi:hypothetical protein